jgi:hypothetical protein
MKYARIAVNVFIDLKVENRPKYKPPALRRAKQFATFNNIIPTYFDIKGCACNSVFCNYISHLIK